MLNLSKGPAVHSPRAQEDKEEYHKGMLALLKKQENLTLLEDEVIDLIVSHETIRGVVLKNSGEITAKAAIIATGTYLRGVRLRGSEREKGGPLGFSASYDLSKALKSKGVKLRRFKTGTPARVDKETIDTEGLEEQRGDDEGVVFSTLTDKPNSNKISCHLTYTNDGSHEIVRENLNKSALYGGKTEGVGPRYCLCIEDKVVRFPDRERHQVFLEPEGIKSKEVYLQGLNINLPKNLQKKFYRSIKGLEKVKFTSFGYTIEYDCIEPSELKISLESKKIKGLFFAGQIIGSSGYEEAAASGLIVGINASRKLDNKDPIILGRDEAYIGVLIDDIVTKQPEEPYRIMTSRAEYRLILRQDNADERLTKIGRKIGLVSDERWNKFQALQKEIKRIKKGGQSGKIATGWALAMTGATTKKEATVIPSESSVFASEAKQSPRDVIPKQSSVIPKQSEESYKEVQHNTPQDSSHPFGMTPLEREAKKRIAIEKHYAGYIEKAKKEIEKFRKNEDKKLPEDLDYRSLKGLKKEAAEKLNREKPANIGIASRLPGVSPADITVLLIYLLKDKKNENR
jgi:tRNA uridine 5-carboxymethylaminomethyl modification enzyme